jgi:mRNA interferase MazF
MVIERGEIWWAELPEPGGSGPGGRRPVVVISSDLFSRSTIRTVIIAVFTSRLERAGAPGNFLVPAEQSGLTRDSVINVSQLFTVDRTTLTQRIGHLPAKHVKLLDEGVRLALAL